MSPPPLPPLRCLLVDDEPLAHTVLRAYLDRLPQLVRWAGSCYDGPEALHALLTTPVDVLFLDVDMPGLSGLELLRALPQPPAVVLTTAHAAHALTAYELGVVDYLLKPIEFERFVKTIGRLRPAIPHPSALVASPTAGGSPDRLFLKTEGGSERVRYTELLVLEGYGNFVKVHRLGARLLLTPTTLKELIDRLPAPQFLRVHKSYVVNLAQVEQVSGNYLQVGSHQIPIGHTYRQDVLRRLHLA